MMLLANKSPADEFIEDFFGEFPIRARQPRCMLAFPGERESIGPESHGL
jgi:hypothetical protein